MTTWACSLWETAPETIREIVNQFLHSSIPEIFAVFFAIVAVIIDQHFTQRNRLGRLLTASSFNPFLIGLGIDEDTAAFIGPDDVLEVVGTGTVTVVDAGQLTHSSMWDAQPGEALSLIGLRLDVLGEGCRYDLKARIGYPPPEHLVDPSIVQTST